MNMEQTLYDVIVVGGGPAGLAAAIEAAANGAGRVVLLAVSYTHLDVYKRQAQQAEPKIIAQGASGQHGHGGQLFERIKFFH